MKKIVALTAFFAVGVLFSFTAASQPRDRYVVVLSMDGFRWDYPGYVQTPALDSVRNVGVYAEALPVFPSNTFPNHYSMATGLLPDKHGIVDNDFYDSRLEKHYSMGNPDHQSDPDFWGGEPIWNTAERQGVRSSVLMWVGSEAPVNGQRASKWLGYRPMDYTELADMVLEELHRPVDSIPRLVMWYFDEPDLAGHRHTPLSEETFSQVSRIDQVLRYFLERVRTSPVYDKTDFIFTSDHGMAEISPERYVNLYPLLDGKKVQYIKGSTPMHVQVENDYLHEAKTIINSIPHLTAYDRAEMIGKFNFGNNTDRVPNLLIVPDTGWRTDYRESDNPHRGGAHGYDPENRDMHMVFYAFGPDFRENYVHPELFRNLNLHVLIATLLGIEPAPNDGDLSEIEGMLRGR